MNYRQRLLVVASLVVVGLVLGFSTVSVGSGGYDETIIIGIYDAPNPQAPIFPYHYGIYTRFGVAGILLGLVAPLCLFAAAAFVALGGRTESK